MTHDINQIANCLDNITKELQIIKSQQIIHNRDNAVNFSPFEFIWTDERKLSEIIAFFLDIKASHGQGGLFLNEFLKYADFKNSDYDDIEITCEKRLKDSGRFHDILIIGKLNNHINWVIGIENKLRNASDQQNQMSDYLDDIASYHCPQYKLFYLTILGDKPSEYSITENKWLDNQQYLGLLSAWDIIKWLNGVKIPAKNIDIFVQQFVAVLKESVLNMRDENNPLIDIITKKPENVKTSMDIIKAGEQLKLNLIKILVEQLKENAKELGDDWEFCIYQDLKRADDIKDWSKGHVMFVFQPKSGKIRIGFGSDESNLMEVFFGVCADTNDPNTCDELQKVLMGYREQSVVWQTWYFSQKFGKEWGDNSEFWSAIGTGEVADYVMFEVKTLKDFLQENQVKFD